MTTLDIIHRERIRFAIRSKNAGVVDVQAHLLRDDKTLLVMGFNGSNEPTSVSIFEISSPKLWTPKFKLEIERMFLSSVVKRRGF